MEPGIQTKLHIPSFVLSMMLKLPTILVELSMMLKLPTILVELAMRLLLVLIPMLRGTPVGALMLHPHVLCSSPVAKFGTTITLPVPILGVMIMLNNPTPGTCVKIWSAISFTVLWELLLKWHGTFLRVVLMKGLTLQAS
jgi:hypothetical protein